jgi:pimeloyl-ACP methyl ester carboxylesterase
VASEDESGQIIGLVLEAPIGSVGTMVGDATYLNIPGSYVSSYSGDNAERIKQVPVPLLWLHGTRDETLDHQTNGRAVWDSYRGEAGYCIVIDGGAHSTLPQTLGYGRYVEAVGGFFAGTVPGWVSCRK